MTSRELVIKTLEFDSPDRVPRDMWTLPWATDHYPDEVKKIREDFPMDIVTSPPCYKNIPESVYDDSPMYEPGEWTDTWGSTFINMQKGIVGEVKDPPVKTWDNPGEIRIPEEFLDIDVAEINAFCKKTDKFVLGPALGTVDLPRPFERLQFLRGTAELYMDLIDRPAGFNRYLERLHEYYVKVAEVWAQTDVDGIAFMDDWGSQNSLLISPAMWREIFKPYYKDYIDIAHKYGKKAFMHSDGYITDVYPDLVELGLDALNSQIFCMDIEELGRQYKGKITFWGEIDRQYLLANGTVEEIAEAVIRSKEALYSNGGTIAQCEFSAGSKPENVYTVYKTWNSF